MSKSIFGSWWGTYVNPLDSILEVYRCTFCDFDSSKWDIIQDHYYHNHMKDVNNLLGIRTDNIDYINGPKSFVPVD